MFKVFCTFWWSTWAHTAYSVTMKSVMLLLNYLYFPVIKSESFNILFSRIESEDIKVLHSCVFVLFTVCKNKQQCNNDKIMNRSCNRA
jgi:hypothetical protein